MKFQIPEALSYADVSLKPKYSEVVSRSLVDLSVEVKDWKFRSPIIIANMASLLSQTMVIKSLCNHNLTLMHRFCSLDEQIKLIEHVKAKRLNDEYLGMSLGVHQIDKENLNEFYNLGIRIFCIDVAHGDNKLCVDMIEFVKRHYEDTLLIAGNVCTGTGAVRLWEAGADMVKIGVGSGSICTTRVETGNGVPMFSALQEVAFCKGLFEAEHPDRQIYMIADGGASNSGDLVKALCFADFTMVGSLFSGSIDCPGDVVELNATAYKSYAGSSTHKSSRVEGVKAMVKVKPNYDTILNRLLEGIQSGCSYQAANNLNELKVAPQFVKVTSSGLRESQPHDLDIIKG